MRAVYEAGRERRGRLSERGEIRGSRRRRSLIA